MLLVAFIIIGVIVGVILLVYFFVTKRPTVTKTCQCPLDSFCQGGTCYKRLGAACDSSQECPNYLACLEAVNGQHQCLLPPETTCSPASTLVNHGCSKGYECDTQLSVCLPSLETTCLPESTSTPKRCSGTLECSNNECLLVDGSVCSSNSQCGSAVCYFNTCRALSGSACNDPNASGYDQADPIVLCLNGSACVERECT